MAFDDAIQVLYNAKDKERMKGHREQRLVARDYLIALLKRYDLDTSGAVFDQQPGHENEITLDGITFWIPEIWSINDPEYSRVMVNMHYRGSGFEVEKSALPISPIPEEKEAYDMQMAARFRLWRDFSLRREDLLPKVLIINGGVNTILEVDNLSWRLQTALREDWQIQSVNYVAASTRYPTYVEAFYTLVKNIPLETF